MLKKFVYISLFFLFGTNSTSLTIGIRVPIFTILLLIFIFGIVGKVLLDLKNKNWQNLKENYVGKGNRYYILVMGAWLAYAGISVFWQRDYGNWRIAMNYLIIGCFCAFVFPLFLRTTRDILNAYRVMGLLLLIHNIIGWFEFITRIYLFPSASDAAGWAGRPVSIFYNTNNFAVFLVFGIFILFVNYSDYEGKLAKRGCLLLALSSICLILLTRSRGALLTLAFGIAIFVGTLYFAKIKEKVMSLLRRKRSRIIMLIGMGVLLVVTVVVVHQMFFAGERAVSGMARLNLIRNGFMFLPITFGFGVGAGNIEHWMDNYWGFRTYGMTNMHNWWMEILTAYGILIFILYLIFYVKLGKSTVEKYVKIKTVNIRAIHLANLCILGGFVIASTIPSSMMPAIWFWALVGILIAAQREDIYE